MPVVLVMLAVLAMLAVLVIVVMAARVPHLLLQATHRVPEHLAQATEQLVAEVTSEQPVTPEQLVVLAVLASPLETPPPLGRLLPMALVPTAWGLATSALLMEIQQPMG
jgi:hypothetical protein